ncbi:MAG: WG repeat-containing protein [Candidatus Roizmanbacteria bacterium]|nr:WG repeat-containing protein [Candidatus Roizmanbacteria bacterium]
MAGGELPGQQKALIDCGYLPVKTKANPNPELTFFPNCVYKNGNGNFVIPDSHLKNIFFDADNLACVYLKRADNLKGADNLYVNRSGKTVRVLPFDNGCDYFQEGLSRTVKDGKLGYINKDLDVVIPPKYDFAFHFNSGVAVVCIGCYSVPIGKDDEHMEVAGGKWGYIDKKGNVVVSISHERDKIPKPPKVVAK